MSVTRRLVFMAAMAGATVAAPVAARADYRDCPRCQPPTPQQCRQPRPFEPGEQPTGFWATSCGRCLSVQHACDLRAYEEAELAVEDLPATVAPVPAGMDGYLAWDAARATPTLTPASPVTIKSPPAWQQLVTRNAWEANGPAVASCAEYAFETYHDWNRFEDAILAAGDNYRAAFVAGLAILDDADHIADRSGRERAVYQPPSSTPQPKNAYFTLRRRYPDEALRYAWSDPRLAVVDGATPTYPAHTLAWHRRMAAALPDNDELLDALRSKQAQFVRALAERATIEKRFGDYAAALAEARASCEARTTPMPGEHAPVNPWFDFQISPLDLTLVSSQALAEAYAPSAFAGISTRLSSPAGETLTLMAPPSGLLARLSGVGQVQLRSYTPAEDSSMAWVPNDGHFDVFGMPVVTNGQCDDLARLLADEAQARRAVSEALAQFDKQVLEPALIGAADHGCLDVSRDGAGELVPGPCDWNPRLLIDESRDFLDEEREAALARCVRFTSDDFSANAPIHRAAQLQIATPARVQQVLPSGTAAVDDWTTSTTALEQYIALVRAWGAEVKFPVDPATGKAYAGEMTHDDDTMGNDTFGVTYEYTLGWRLGDFHGLGGAACKASVTAEASFKADANVLGKPFNLVNAMAKVETKPAARSATDPDAPDRRQFSRTLTFEVLGFDLIALAQTELARDSDKDVPQQPTNQTCQDSDRDGDGFGAGCAAGPDCDEGNGALHTGCLSGTASADVELPGATFEVNFAKSQSKDSEKLQQTFPVAGVPVTIRAWVTGTVGIEVAIKGALYQMCPQLELGVSGLVKPYAQLEVKVSGGVNLAAAEIGLQVDLTLLRIDLPFKLSFKLGLYDQQGVRDGSVSELRLVASPELRMVLTTLSGQLQAYVTFPLLKPIYFKLFSWSGLVLADVPLFHESWSLPLMQLAIGLDSGDADYQRRKGTL